MPSAFSWPMSVPSSLRLPAPVNQGVRLLFNSRKIAARRAAHPLFIGHSASWPRCFLCQRTISAVVTPRPVSPQPHRKTTCTAGLLSAPVAHTTGKSFAILSAHQVSTSLMHRVVPHGALARLNLAVSPSAACSPICCAKVPHTIALLAARPTAVSAPVLVFNRSSYLGKLA